MVALKMDDFNNWAMFKGNLGAIVDCGNFNVRKLNVKEVQTIMKKLQKSGFGEEEVKMIMYLNLAIFMLNLASKKQYA